MIPRTGLPSTQSTCIDISIETNPTIYLGNYYGGIYNFIVSVSSQWTQIMHGVNATYINDIAVHPSSPNLAYACIKDEYGLFKTVDGGVYWNRVNSGLPDLVAIDPQNPSILYSAESEQEGSEYYIYKSINSGVNWLQIQFASCTGNSCSTKLTDILIHPTNTQNILVATCLEWYSDGPRGFGTVSRSTDGGNSWDELLNAPSTALSLDPNDPNILYSGKERSGQIWKIQDCWGNVPLITEITPNDGMGDITDIEVDNNSNIYVSTESGLWKYTGGNWTELILPSTDITSLGIDRNTAPNVIYAGTRNSGVFISNDEGFTWNIWNAGLKTLAITKLRIGGSKVWVGTEYGGVWCRNTTQSVIPEYDLQFSSLADMNNARFGAGYTCDGNYIYSVSGSISQSPWLSTSIERYNLLSGTWTEFTNGLIPRTWCSAEYVSSQNKIYIFNGETYTSTTYTDTIEIVDAGTGTISYSASNPYPVEYGGSAAWNDKIYVFGGSNSDGYSNRLYEFDPQSDTWTRLTDMEEAKQTSGRIIDGVLYVFGGYNGSTSKRIDAYDIQNSTWTSLGTLPVGISTHATAISGNYIWLVGSYNNLTFLAVYNTETNKFTQLSSNMIGRRHAGASVAGNNLYIFGGNQASSSSSALNSLQYTEISYYVIENAIDEIMTLVDFSLNQNYPNPFNPTTAIEYSLPQDGHISIRVFDLLGQEVKTLVNEYKFAGEHQIQFDGSNLSNGVYFYRIIMDDNIKTKKMLLMK